MVFADEFLDSTDLCSRKSAAALQPNWIKPELCNFVVPLNVTMLGLIAIPCVKEETIWTDSQYGRHLFQLHTNFFSIARSYQILKTSWTLTRLIIKPQAARRLRKRRGVWPYASTSFPFLLPQVGKEQNSQIRKVGSAHPIAASTLKLCVVEPPFDFAAPRLRSGRTDFSFRLCTISE